MIFIEQGCPIASKSVRKASKSVPRASHERPRTRQERPKSGLGVSKWLQVVASGGSPAALGGRWRGGGEVNLSVNDHQAVFVQNLAALRRGAGGFRTLTRNRRTLKGFHAFGLLRMFSGISLGSCMDFARNSHRFCKERTCKSPPGGPKSISAGAKSTSDRLEDS